MNHEREIECPGCHLALLLKGSWEENLRVYAEILTQNQVNGRQGGGGKKHMLEDIDTRPKMTPYFPKGRETAFCGAEGCKNERMGQGRGKPRKEFCASHLPVEHTARPVRKGMPPRSEHQAHTVDGRKDMEDSNDGVWDDKPLTREQWDFVKDNQKTGDMPALTLAKEMNMPYSQIVLAQKSFSYEEFCKTRVEGRVMVKEKVE